MKDLTYDTYKKLHPKSKGLSGDELRSFFEDLFDKVLDAEEEGWKNVTVTFESTIEPYEDYPGDVEILISGYRGKTQQELKDEDKQKEITKLSKKLGVTYYEASIVKRLYDENKLRAGHPMINLVESK